MSAPVAVLFSALTICDAEFNYRPAAMFADPRVVDCLAANGKHEVNRVWDARGYHAVQVLGLPLVAMDGIPPGVVLFLGPRHLQESWWTSGERKKTAIADWMSDTEIVRCTVEVKSA